MINEVRIVGNDLAISISLDSEINFMQSIDCYNGSQVYILKGVNRDDLYVLMHAITQALEIEV